MARELRYAVDVTADGELTEEHGVPLDVPPEWSPEHLLLAALVRCSLKSLRFHAERMGIPLLGASGAGRTLVTKRDPDGRYAAVDAVVELALEIAPEPAPPVLAELLASAERDCFVGSSLTAKPTYRWVVNGRTIES